MTAAIHVIVLILAAAGQPERIATVLPEGPQGMALCNKLGAEAQAEWAKMFARQPHDFSYRCEPGLAMKLGKSAEKVQFNPTPK